MIQNNSFDVREFRRSYDYNNNRYIESHFGEIIGHESEIESRLVYADCTMDVLKADNKSIIDGFQRAGEQVMVIEEDYEKTIHLLLE